MSFWQFVIVFQVMVPIALYISMEVIKSLQVGNKVSSRERVLF
jgi:magnesium-transporting ATPase (P-type)